MKQSMLCIRNEKSTRQPIKCLLEQVAEGKEKDDEEREQESNVGFGKMSKTQSTSQRQSRGKGYLFCKIK
jgi:hypothetical protein